MILVERRKGGRELLVVGVVGNAGKELCETGEGRSKCVLSYVNGTREGEVLFVFCVSVNRFGK